MPQSRQPFLHDLVCLLAAPTQAWSPDDGQVRPVPDGGSGLTGLLHADVRVLAGLEVTVDGGAGEHIATRPDGSAAVFTTLLRHVGAELAPTPDPQVRLDQVRRVAPGGLTEELQLSSSLDAAVPLEVAVTLTSDATPVERIKDGRPVVPAPVEQDGETLRWTADAIEVSVVAPDAAVEVAQDRSSATLRWSVELPARGRVGLGWQLSVREPAGVVVAAPAKSVPPVAVRSPDHRLGRWLERSLADLQSLRMSTPHAPDDVFYAAGAPWYLTLFGRDSLWAARMTLPLDPAVALGTLRTLARLQGTRDDPRTAEEPGKIPHELRRAGFSLGEMALPPLYYGTVDATALWVCLLHDAWRAGLPGGEVRDLLPALEAALGWLTRDGDGFLTYLDASGSGLANQGWKDSADAVRFADGSLATGAIALCEAQGYAYEAAVCGAALLDALQRPGAEPLRAWAGRLQQRFRAAFWCPSTSAGDGEDPFPAIALDGDGRPVDSLTSNIGHLLGTGLLSPEEERVVARHLTGPALDSGLGLRTLAATEAAYAPLSYHCGSVWPHDTAIAIDGLYRAGLGDRAAGLVEGLLRAAVAFHGRLPELWSGEGEPVPYPASCRPQAWSAAAAVVVAHRLDAL